MFRNEDVLEGDVDSFVDYGVSVVNNIAQGLTILSASFKHWSKGPYSRYTKYNETRGIASSKMTAMLESFQLKY